MTEDSAQQTDATAAFLRAVQRSQLVAAERLNECLTLSRSKHRGRLPDTPQKVADDLVAAGVLTTWQVQQLLTGKKRGFFLGKYKLLKPLGRGGMGTVYLAEHTHLRRRAAIKVFSLRESESPNTMKRFEAEAQAAAQLDHPHIVRAYDFDFVDPYYYFAMEYVPGTDLGRLVHEKGPLPVHLALDFIRQAALGLAHAHQKGIVHRDIKPANLLLTKENVVKVADLGLALVPREEDGSMTIEHKQVLGTADYVAPEQALDSHSVDHRADIYSLGCTLYHLLTGKPPFAGGTVAQRLARHQVAMPAAIVQLRLDCPPQVAALCWKMLQKQPSERIQTSADLVMKITQLLKSEALASQTLPSSLGQAKGLSSMNLPKFPSTVSSLAGQAGWDTVSSLSVSGIALPYGSSSMAQLPSAAQLSVKQRNDLAFQRRLKIYIGVILGGGLLSLGIFAWLWLGEGRESAATKKKATEGGVSITVMEDQTILVRPKEEQRSSSDGTTPRPSEPSTAPVAQPSGSSNSNGVIPADQPRPVPPIDPAPVVPPPAGTPALSREG
jgi:serine/threonine-protein kinase